MDGAYSTFLGYFSGQDSPAKDAQHFEVDEVRRMADDVAGKQAIEQILGARGAENHIENDGRVNDRGGD